MNLGIDIGSTTVKVVLTDDEKIIYKSYRRHLANPGAILLEELNKIKSLSSKKVKCAITGSGGLDLAKLIGVNFAQEVFVTANYVPTLNKDVDVVIELGGEDAKIIFLTGSIEEKMNGSCAGGTGAFIDQMASLLNVSVDEMDELSLEADAIYPIASRCGVFAKSDIQPLINQGATKANIAKSVFQAVVDQTIGGLAGGRLISGNVLYLGGPLTFCKGLRETFINSLPDTKPIILEDSEYFVCFATAYYASEMQDEYDLLEIIHNIESLDKKQITSEEKALFTSEEEYDLFIKRHNKEDVKYDLALANTKEVYVGLDAGSTTTKLVAINQDNEIVFSMYKGNKGNPLDTVREELLDLYNAIGEIPVKGAVVTGYGEELMMEAYGFDSGVVETVAHFTASKYFLPEVNTIIDIGGQDMKCFRIKHNAIDSIMLNEACSSGCGSFLETFAKSMRYSVEEFAKMALFASHPVDLGSRCTVFMNSSVKQAQKNGASVADIAAGLSISVVKNALYKVLRVASPKDLGEHVIVQGGTFKNDAVLRAFEMHLGIAVTRPSIAGLMGAFGASLLAKDFKNSKLLDKISLENFKYESKFTRCNLCQNKCALTVNSFSSITKKFISGNRCTRPLGLKQEEILPNVYRFKNNYFEKFFKSEINKDKLTVGLPFVLNFYDSLPYFYTLISELGFNVIVSGKSSRKLYRKGQHTITSDTICYGAKLVHGHILTLVDERPDLIFYPKMSYNFDEGTSNNYFNCPVVAYYPEVIKANMDFKGISFIDPYLDLNNDKKLAKELLESFKPYNINLTLKDVNNAIVKAKQALEEYRLAVKNEAKRAIKFANENGKKIICLVGRPYHVDEEINHGLDEIISRLGIVVLSEDSLEYKNEEMKLNVLNQWTYHNRMYQAANAIIDMPNTELIQLVSFGCGLDAVTTDELNEFLTSHGKFYTAIKIDEINNLGAAKIRVRSLLAAMEEKYGK